MHTTREACFSPAEGSRLLPFPSQYLGVDRIGPSLFRAELFFVLVVHTENMLCEFERPVQKTSRKDRQACCFEGYRFVQKALTFKPVKTF